MKKIADFESVEPKELPRIARYLPSSRSVGHVPIMHRIDRYGVSTILDVPVHRELKEDITVCNRVFDNSLTYTQSTDDLAKAVLSGMYRLCSRCGTLEEFQKTLTTYHEVWHKLEEESKAKEQAKREELERQYQEDVDGMLVLHRDLTRLVQLKPHMFCQPVGEPVYYGEDNTIILSHYGRQFKVEILPKKKPEEGG